MIRKNKKPRLNWIDFAVISSVVGFLIFVVLRVDSVLNYSWNWNHVFPFVLVQASQTHALGS